MRLGTDDNAYSKGGHTTLDVAVLWGMHELAVTYKPDPAEAVDRDGYTAGRTSCGR